MGLKVCLEVRRGDVLPDASQISSRSRNAEAAKLLIYASQYTASLSKCACFAALQTFRWHFSDQ
jgi:hypothetical protein